MRCRARPPEPMTPTFRVSLAGNPVATEPTTVAAAAVPAARRKLRREGEVSTGRPSEVAGTGGPLWRVGRRPTRGWRLKFIQRAPGPGRAGADETAIELSG